MTKNTIDCREIFEELACGQGRGGWGLRGEDVMFCDVMFPCGCYVLSARNMLRGGGICRLLSEGRLLWPWVSIRVNCPSPPLAFVCFPVNVRQQERRGDVRIIYE